jgi:hypothetical protein
MQAARHAGGARCALRAGGARLARLARRARRARAQARKPVPRAHRADARARRAVRARPAGALARRGRVQCVLRAHGRRVLRGGAAPNPYLVRVVTVSAPPEAGVFALGASALAAPFAAPFATPFAAEALPRAPRPCFRRVVRCKAAPPLGPNPYLTAL